MLRSCTIPSSVAELDSGGDGVADLKAADADEESPLLLPAGEGRSDM